MNVLLLGKDGRTHALAWKLTQSPLLSNLYIAPGNGGTLAHGYNVALDPLQFTELKKFCRDKEIDMIIVGPEDPIAQGIKDAFQKEITYVLAPPKQAALLESSKVFAKRFMQKYHIPTAAFQTFEKKEENLAEQYLKKARYPLVIKADGLAAGKGVSIAHNVEEGIEQMREHLVHEKFGQASQKIVIEEYLKGLELSVFLLVEGKKFEWLGTAKDYKRAYEGDEGPNTGGMGAVSDVPYATQTLKERIIKKIIQPTLKGLSLEKMHYEGFLYLGLMIVNQEPYVLEYNVRLGDPETQALIPRMESDLLELCHAIHEKRLEKKLIITNPKKVVTIVLASEGYPNHYETGFEITGLKEIRGALVFHAGTTRKGDSLFTSGGRVLSISAFGDTIEEARNLALQNAEKVVFQNRFFRKDIGIDLLPFEKGK
jgi:phosphoribosylamine--glycine ligase